MKNLYDYERTQSATTDLPFGALKNESSPGKQDGTDIVAEHIQDLAYSLYQVLQLAGINPNGELEDGNNKTQFIESLTNIGVFRYSDKTSYNYGVFAWQVIGNTFTLYRSLKNSNSDDVNNNESWLKILEIGADNKINFNVDTNILGLSANPSLSNLSEAGEDRLNVSKMYETGAVSNDTKGFKELLKRAHSTFDKSKFTIKGSPIITDDGIASNFTNSNYAETIPVSKISLNTFMITCDFKWIGDQGTIFSSARSGSTEYGIALIINVNKLAFYSSSNGTEWNVVNFKIGSTPLVSKNIYKVSVIFTGTQYICMLLNKNTGALTTEFTIDSTDKVFAGLNMISFGGNSYWKPLNGSIDLKSIAIWSDGIPVFNGNKTGLYVAKSDNYEVVGSPTITDDGILSDLSNSNYIKTNINLSSTYRIEIDLDILDTPSVSQLFIDIFRGTKHLKGYIGPSGNLEFFFQDGVSNSYCGSVKPNFNQKNKILFELTQDQAITQCNDSSQTITRDSIPVELILTGECIFYIGKGEVIKSINLNSIKVYSDGNLIYQPCLKIPYNETFEHPNVVDVAYRNRVQDLYEQTGEALFYTIDEENQDFTLPMGDIYGMITKNREILDIVYPIGRPMPEENNVLLDNEVWLEGATPNPIDYPKLFKVYGTKYGGDGITTFGLPDLRGRVLWGSPDGSNGYIEAKLPNIKGGSVLHSQDADGALNGCFYTTRSSISGNAQFPSNGRSYATFGAGINANLSNEIYSDDATTVQPPAFKVRWKTRFE